MTITCKKCSVKFTASPESCDRCPWKHFKANAFNCTSCGFDNRSQVIKAFANAGVITGAHDALASPSPCGS